MYPLQEPSYGR